MLLLCPSQKLRKDYRKEIRSADKSDETKHSAARDVMASLRSRADPEEDARERFLSPLGILDDLFDFGVIYLGALPSCELSLLLACVKRSELLW